MTGYGSVEGTVGQQRVRVEAKALNHRFLDLKVRLPRELAAAEMPLRAAVQSRFSRGAIDLKVERAAPEGTAASEPAIQPNLSLAANYFEALITIQKTLGLSDPIRTVDVASFPDVMSRAAAEIPPEEAWKRLEPVVEQALARLAEDRAREGAALRRVLAGALDELGAKLSFLRERRAACESQCRDRVRDKVKAVFDAYPVAAQSAQAALESRISQELALLIDRTDVEEELVRFEGHLAHFRKVLDEGGPVGRKLDFVLQELGREVNTLGNKAQDLQIGEEVVELKVRLEQMREQVMNLE
jgi:uncharacterized protein (TIGR00255 family)